jgi:hypothetical protein
MRLFGQFHETVRKVLSSPEKVLYETTGEDEETPFRCFLATSTCT